MRHDAAGKELSIAMGPTAPVQQGSWHLGFRSRANDEYGCFCLWIRDTAWNSTARCDLVEGVSLGLFGVGSYVRQKNKLI